MLGRKNGSNQPILRQKTGHGGTSRGREAANASRHKGGRPRNESEAAMHPATKNPVRGREPPRQGKRLTLAESDSPFREIIGRQFNAHLVAGHDADEILSHLSGHVGDDRVAPIERHAKSRVGEGLSHDPFDFQRFFFFAP